MNIRIKTKDSITGFTIPCSEEQIDKLCEVLGISNNSQAEITVDSVYMDDRANGLLQNKTFNLDKLNYLAKRLDSFDKNELTTFYAVSYSEKAMTSTGSSISPSIPTVTVL